MALDELMRVLRESELDQETKLGLIELLARADNPALLADLEQLVLQWDRTDNAQEAKFVEQLQALAAAHAARADAADMNAMHREQAVADEAKALETISKLKTP